MNRTLVVSTAVIALVAGHYLGQRPATNAAGAAQGGPTTGRIAVININKIIKGYERANVEGRRLLDLGGNGRFPFSD